MSGAQGRGPRRRGRGGLILPLVIDGEAVRGDRAPVATGSVEQGRRPGVRWAGWSGWAKAHGGRGFLSPFHFLFKTFLFSFNSSLLHFLLQ